MTRALRLTRLLDPRPEPPARATDLRTRDASEPDLCQSCRSGHHSHWIPMRRATQDPEGEWGTVVSVHDDGPLLVLDRGGEVRLRHHAMARHGQALVEHPRVFWQGRWGWLWSGGLGISVTSTDRWTPCSPGRPDPRPAARHRSTLPGVPGASECTVVGRGHQPEPAARTGLRTASVLEVRPTRVLRADEDGIVLVGVPGTWWMHDLERFQALVQVLGTSGVWHPGSKLLGLPDGAGLLPIPLRPQGRGRERCRAADGALLHPPGTVGPR